MASVLTGKCGENLDSVLKNFFKLECNFYTEMRESSCLGRFDTNQVQRGFSLSPLGTPPQNHKNLRRFQNFVAKKGHFVTTIPHFLIQVLT